MKTKLLKLVWHRAKFRAHINSLTTETRFGISFVSKIEIGYGIAREKELYDNIFSSDMDVKTFDRLVRQRYWELNKNYYYRNYAKRNRSGRK